MNTLKQLIKFLNKKYDFQYNEVTGQFYYKEKENESFNLINDFILNSLFVESKTKIKGLSLTDFISCLKSDLCVIKNPFKEYFDNLPKWDEKTDHIKILSQTIKSTNKTFWNKYFKKWLVGSVASVLNDECTNHLVLIFVGKQGVGKTTWLNKLTPKTLKDHLYMGTIRFDKDSIINLSECMFINIDEFETIGKKGLNELKSIITMDKIRVRRPYGKITENLVRRSSFTASVNNPTFLVDTTGNRRFIVIEVEDINYNHKVNLDDVYSQCKYLFENGFEFYLNQRENERVNKMNERFLIRTFEEELLLEFFKPCKPNSNGELLTTTQILNKINDESKTFMNNNSIYSLGRALSKNHFEKGRTKDKGHGWWVLKKIPNRKNDYKN